MQLKPLDKGSPVPLYQQLSATLIAQIGSGDLKPGDRIPSERELAMFLGVSRITARLAIDELLESGLIFRAQGRGTFVAERKMHGLKGFLSFTEDIHTRGMQARSQILRQEAVVPDAALQQALKLQPGELALRLDRLRFADDKPLAVQSSHLPLRICPGLEKQDLTDKSLFAVLREQYYVHPIWTEAEVQAMTAAPDEAALLGLSTGAPVLVITALTFTDSFEVVESVRTTYRHHLAIYIGRQRL